jgi:hypothetical protein
VGSEAVECCNATGSASPRRDGIGILASFPLFHVIYIHINVYFGIACFDYAKTLVNWSLRSPGLARQKNRVMRISIVSGKMCVWGCGIRYAAAEQQCGLVMFNFRLWSG